jgi:hypothetical protein
MDNRCFGPTCNGLTTQGFDKANKCIVPTVVKEDNDGCELPLFPSYLHVCGKGVDADVSR